MNYFINCTTLDDAKNLFRNLCKKLHPDTSGFSSQSEFITMFKEFKAFKPSTTDKNDLNFNASKFYDMIKQFEHLQDINVSFVGSFVWLEDVKQGATYQQKDGIKSIKIEGYNAARFAGKKKAWYFSPLNYKQFSNGKKTLSEIKNTFGCNTFAMQGNKKLGA
jgi:hypothetical protein